MSSVRSNKVFSSSLVLHFGAPFFFVSSSLLDPLASFGGGHLAKVVVFEERERESLSIKKEEVRGSSRRWFVFFERKERPRRRGLLLSFQKSFLFFALSRVFQKSPLSGKKLTRRSFLFFLFFLS